MTAYVEALLLGVVQGIAEFLPISSSGHLVIIGEVLRGISGRMSNPEENLQLNIAVHAGTLGSILVVYRAEVWRLFRLPRIVGLLIVATLPLVALALVLDDEIEAAFSDPLLAGCGLLFTAGLLAMSTRFREGRTDVDDTTPRQAAGVGLCQMLAVLPGVSRAGSTIVGGLAMGLRREAATTFSFLIAIPAILGATVLLLRDVVGGGGGTVNVGPLLVGGLVAGLVGIVSLRGLIRIVSAGRLHWFAAYCAIVGLGTIVWQLGWHGATRWPG